MSWVMFSHKAPQAMETSGHISYYSLALDNVQLQLPESMDHVKQAIDYGWSQNPASCV